MRLLRSLANYTKETWRRRYFWLSLARLDLEQRYHGSVFGLFWSLLHPLCMTAILCFVFVAIFGVDPHTYIPFLLSGMAPWSFISSAFIEGCQSIRKAEKFMRVYPAPIAIYGLRTLCSASFHFLVILVVSLLFSWALGGVGNLAALFSLIPAVALLLVWGFSIILIFGVLDAYFPDNKHIVQVALQMLFYMMPIIYPPESLHNEFFRKFIDYNPLASFVVLIRMPITGGAVAPLGAWLMASVTTFVSLAIAAWVVHVTERRIIFQL